MHLDLGQREAAEDYCFLDPKHHVVTGPTLIVSEVVIEAQLLDIACFQKRDGL